MVFNRYQFPKRKLALIIPGYNEEVVIADTISSAMAAGQHTSDIYVVSDGSSDRTVEIATELLGADHVLDQANSGKARAILNGMNHFNIPERYVWLHIADADGVFATTYFNEIHARLSRDYVAATGYVQSLKGGWISKFRVYEYTLGLEIYRRIQAFFGVIPVIPGPTSMFRTDILNKLDFTVDSLTEDMDITLQIHRKKLGKIQYIPQAKTYTQDPKDLTDYIKQVSRWYRGNFQVMQRHHVGFRPHRIDAYIAFVMFEQWIFLAQLIALPFFAWWGQNYATLAIVFLNDIIFFLSFTIWAAAASKRTDVLSAFPLFYILRFVNIYIFVRSWYEIVVQRKFRTARPGWSTAGRRYRITTDAVVS